jgi:two-component system, NtrC family, response regulator AtoC
MDTDNEHKILIHALKETGGVQVQAAKLLGIAQRSLWHRIKKLAIRVDRTVRE